MDPHTATTSATVSPYGHPTDPLMDPLCLQALNKEACGDTNAVQRGLKGATLGSQPLNVLGLLCATAEREHPGDVNWYCALEWRMVVRVALPMDSVCCEISVCPTHTRVRKHVCARTSLDILVRTFHEEKPTYTVPLWTHPLWTPYGPPMDPYGPLWVSRTDTPRWRQIVCTY